MSRHLETNISFEKISTVSLGGAADEGQRPEGRRKGTRSQLEGPRSERQREQIHENRLNFQAFSGRELPDP